MNNSETFRVEARESNAPGASRLKYHFLIPNDPNFRFTDKVLAVMHGATTPGRSTQHLNYPLVVELIESENRPRVEVHDGVEVFRGKYTGELSSDPENAVAAINKAFATQGVEKALAAA